MPAENDEYYRLMDQQLLDCDGEQCTYIPLGGEAREVVAAVEEESTLSDGGRQSTTAAAYHVLVMRDADNADYGGIATPQLGDTFLRSPLADISDADAFSYQGVKREVSSSAWVLTFSRSLPHEIGGIRR